MKRLRFLNKPSLLLCFFVWLIISSCSTLRATEETVALSYHLTIDLRPEDGQEQLIESLSSVYIKDIKPDVLKMGTDSAIQRFTIVFVANNLAAFNVFKSKISASGLMVTSLVKEP